MSIQNKLQNPQPVSKASEKADEGRREALKKLGIYGAYAAYTAPALVVLLKSGKAVAQSGGPPIFSDKRLKEDIRVVGELPNGLKLYEFRYVGDHRHFVSVMAQDVLETAGFRHSVSEGADGFYRVDRSALGFEVVNADAMRAAGARAAEIVGSVA